MVSVESGGDIISNRSIRFLNRIGDTSDIKSGSPCAEVAGECASSSSSGTESTPITSKRVGGKSVGDLKTISTNKVQRDLGEGNLSCEKVIRFFRL